jgi:hypothetical protein
MYFVCVGITALEAAADRGVGITQLSCMQWMLVRTQPAVLLYTMQLLLRAHEFRS